MNPLDFVAKKHFDETISKKWLISNIMLNLTGKSRRKYIESKLHQFENLRASLPGDKIYITYDPSDKYIGQQATVLRVLRRHSLRIEIQTQDGKIWRWPMAWLEKDG